MNRKISWAWLSSGLVIVLLLFGTIMLMPTDSASKFQPLVRQRELQSSQDEATTEEEVQKRIDEIYKRNGFSNPDPSPEDQPEVVDDEVVARIDSSSKNRTRRPMTKLGKDFDPKQSYVIKHANGTITYVFPESLISSTTAGSSSGTDSESKKSEPAKETANNDVTYRTSSLNSRDIVFPIDNLDNDECRPDSPICTNVPNYPQRQVDLIVAQHANRFAEVFGNDVVVEDKLVQRFDTSDDEFLCTSEEKLIFPRQGKNITIVNTENYRQGVRVEQCRQEGQACNRLEHLLSIYKTECKQLYHYRTLLAIHPVTKEPYKEIFQLPSCCKCVIRPLSLRKRRDTKEGL